MAKQIGINDLGNELRKLMKGQLHDAVVRGIHSAGYRLQAGVPLAIASTRPHPPQDTGELTRSIKLTKHSEGASVIADAPHAPMVEYGARPHFPPLAPITGWVWRKFDVESWEEAEEIALSICRKIAKYGMQPRHFMLRALTDFRRLKVLKQEVEREIKRIKP